jgi:orotate phosphoribosyltransferase
MINKNELLQLLKDTGALLEGHFKLTSGRHSNRYIEKFRILENPNALDQVCKSMAYPYSDKKIELVLGAAVGGILLAGGVGRHLNVKHIFSERVNGKMAFRRGFHFDHGTRILIVEDIVTTGGSIIELIDLAESMNGVIVGIVNLVTRSSKQMFAGRHLHSLLELPIDSWEPDQCEMCCQSIPITALGSSGKKI